MDEQAIAERLAKSLTAAGDIQFSDYEIETPDNDTVNIRVYYDVEAQGATERDAVAQMKEIAKRIGGGLKGWDLTDLSFRGGRGDIQFSISTPGASYVKDIAERVLKGMS